MFLFTSSIHRLHVFDRAGIASTVCTSDHKPVFSTFEVALLQHDQLAANVADADVSSGTTGLTLGRNILTHPIGPLNPNRLRFLFQLGTLEASFVCRSLSFSPT